MNFKTTFLLISSMTLLLFACKEETNLPVASFSVDKTTVKVGENVNFTNASVDAVSYIWNFGDGKATTTNENPTYAFDEIGTYTVTLKALNEDGSNETSTDIEVIEDARIIPGISLDQYHIYQSWSDIKSIISDDYQILPEYRRELDANTYAHYVWVESQQIGLYFVSSTETLQKTDYLLWEFCVGTYKGKTESKLGIGNTGEDITNEFGEPIDGVVEYMDYEDNPYYSYGYDQEGIYFYVQYNKVFEIDIVPGANTPTISKESFNKLRQSVRKLNK